MNFKRGMKCDTCRGNKGFCATKLYWICRRRGDKKITIRAGDIHRDMQLKSRMPAVCGAIGTKKFEEECGVRLIRRRGPTQGANVYFTFEILSSDSVESWK